MPVSIAHVAYRAHGAARDDMLATQEHTQMYLRTCEALATCLTSVQEQGSSGGECVDGLLSAAEHCARTRRDCLHR